ncbi:MAG: succinate dehydrogenase, cytochrome b556 subunit [Gammaproteobacteria bacterium RIFCSPHIGHO2_12_FULL_37_34]|nr:MAG: succinate dehydrogenase, cytochrome b556 subunit [Gammaproteobacteria bacterium RIFCSPHIGHO2_12_FULL_37_34]
MHNTRPKNLNLFTIHFPIPAIVSILHRLSGIVLFFLIPFVLWGFALSLTDDGFDMLQGFSSLFYIKLIIWIVFIPVCYHLVAGIRHLLMDIHIGTSLAMGRQLAIWTFIVSIFLLFLIGIWLW